MDTSSASHNLDNNTGTEIKTLNNTIKASVLALGVILSSNQMSATPPVNRTENISILSRIDGLLFTNGAYSNITRHNYAERYRIIAESDWFQKAYKNKSIGEIIGIDI
jgi:hypothetical protein